MRVSEILRPLEAKNLCEVCPVRDLAVCGVLSSPELARLDALASRWIGLRGETLFFEGDPADHLFVVTKGVVTLYKQLADGRRQIVGFLFPGDFLGLTARDFHGVGAEAATAVSVCRFPRSAFETLMEDVPDLEMRLLHDASNELAAAQDRMLLLGRKQTSERVATFLIWFSRRAAARDRDPTLVILPMKRGDIGDYLGLTLETVSREFSRMKAAGLIALPDAHQVRLLDREALCELSGLGNEKPAAGARAAIGL